MFKKIIPLFLAFALFACNSNSWPYYSSKGADHRSAKYRADKFNEDENQIVYFDTDSAEISDEQKRLLDRNVVSWLKSKPKTHIIVNGYADEKGNIVTSKILAGRRSLAVKSYLVNKGIKSVRIATDSYSSSFTGASEQSAANREGRGGVVTIVAKK